MCYLINAAFYLERIFIQKVHTNFNSIVLSDDFYIQWTLKKKESNYATNK